MVFTGQVNCPYQTEARTNVLETNRENVDTKTRGDFFFVTLQGCVFLLVEDVLYMQPDRYTLRYR